VQCRILKEAEVGNAGHYLPLTRQFLKSCKMVGIPQVHDINTPEGTLGASKVSVYVDEHHKYHTETNTFSR
jgi:choline dehydrogenase